MVRSWPRSLRCTSVGPGWVTSTSRSRSTTGGTHLATGIDTTNGPESSTDRSGMVRSMAISLGTSSRRSTLPFTTTTASSAIEVAYSW